MFVCYTVTEASALKRGTPKETPSVLEMASLDTVIKQVNGSNTRRLSIERPTRDCVLATRIRACSDTSRYIVDCAVLAVDYADERDIYGLSYLDKYTVLDRIIGNAYTGGFLGVVIRICICMSNSPPLDSCGYFSYHLPICFWHRPNPGTIERTRIIHGDEVYSRDWASSTLRFWHRLERSGSWGRYRHCLRYELFPASSLERVEPKHQRESPGRVSRQER